MLALCSTLPQAMSKKVVEPNRKVLDVQKIYRNKYVTKVSAVTRPRRQQYARLCRRFKGQCQ